MQYNDVAISIRAFVVSDMEDSLYRIQTVKSGKETIIQQFPCFLDNYSFVGDIRCVIQNTVYRLYWLCPVGLGQRHGKKVRYPRFFTMELSLSGTDIDNDYQQRL